MPKDLETLSLKELKELRKDVDTAISSFHEREKAKARAVLEATAKEMGYSLDDILGKKARRVKPTAKYRNPENPAETWSGRGRRPRWLEEALSKGASLEDFAIA
ncbi:MULTISPECIES: H-NS family nucleoid-associated regulatory protein [Rhodovulum]|uniref:DNA-binding protein H-NS n=2 Tax=Rhodovulum TaxID=34008 RepID=A0A8E3ANY3_9RHOB|nr:MULTISPECIES: H-NS histone family protein [Rhodovulum]PTW40301.1 DNA-binding protein H-NS [Rhodovulum kholense]RAP39811.1 transcriptional regulator [Rhodovulum viride]